MAEMQCAACFAKAEHKTRGWYFFEMSCRSRNKPSGAWLCPKCKRPRMGKGGLRR
jgi:uncharacterized protein YlaI